MCFGARSQQTFFRKLESLGYTIDGENMFRVKITEHMFCDYSSSSGIDKYNVYVIQKKKRKTKILHSFYVYKPAKESWVERMVVETHHLYVFKNKDLEQGVLPEDFSLLGDINDYEKYYHYREVSRDDVPRFLSIEYCVKSLFGLSAQQ